MDTSRIEAFSKILSEMGNMFPGPRGKLPGDSLLVYSTKEAFLIWQVDSFEDDGASYFLEGDFRTPNAGAFSPRSKAYPWL